MSLTLHLAHMHLIVFHYYNKIRPFLYFFFFFNDTATTEIYTLSLHDALPILVQDGYVWGRGALDMKGEAIAQLDRKSTRLNSSHSQISYAVFCLKKKKKDITSTRVKVR